VLSTITKSVEIRRAVTLVYMCVYIYIYIHIHTHIHSIALDRALASLMGFMIVRYI
jgi:hypothetical protein